MANDLTDDLVGPTVVSFGAAFPRGQAIGTELLELLAELKIAAATDSEFLCGGLGSEFTFAFDQQGQAACDLVLLRDRQRARITDERVVFEMEDSHDRPSVIGYENPASTGGLTIGKTANLRL